MKLMIKILVAVVTTSTACHNDSERIAALEKRVDGIEKARPAAPPRRPGPDPTAVYYLPVHDADVVRGPKDAKVTVVEAFDFACPFCAMTAVVIEHVQKARPDLVRVVSKNYIVHPQVATDAALGACAAAKQGHGPAYEQKVWAQAWGTGPQPHLDQAQLAPAAIQTAAVAVGLDPKQYSEDVKVCRDTVANEEKELNAIGVGGTPSFFINGRIYQGPRTQEGFLAAIDDAAKKADASGVAKSDYYDSLMKDAKRAM